MARSQRLMVPILRRSSADFLDQISLQDRIAGRWRMFVAPISSMALWMSGLPAYFCTLRVRARSRWDCSPATWASITSPRFAMMAMMSGLRSPSLVVMCGSSYTVKRWRCKFLPKSLRMELWRAIRTPWVRGHICRTWLLVSGTVHPARQLRSPLPATDELEISLRNQKQIKRIYSYTAKNLYAKYILV